MSDRRGLNQDVNNISPGKKENTIMEPTFEPSLPTLPNFFSKMAVIEAIELSFLGFFLSALLLLIPTETPTTLVVAIGIFIIIEAVLLGSWLIYLAYIRLTRGLYPRADIRLRLALAILTSTYTLWAWLILDLNRWILAKLIYRGEAPVEYAWSSKSKLARKEWEQARKAKNAVLSM